MQMALKVIILLSTVYLYACDTKHVDTPPEQLVGCWQETSESQPNQDHLIRELKFRADGSFSVTWYPFEVYTDYWGTYTYSSTNGSLSMVVDGGNYVPEVLVLNGSVETNQKNELVLRDMYLGVLSGSTDVNQLSRKYIFTKLADTCGPTPIPLEVSLALRDQFGQESSIYNQGENIEFLLTIANNTNDEVTVNFPNGAMYDFYIEADGLELWRWSDGLAFILITTSLTVPANDSVTFSEVWNQSLRRDTNIPIPIGNYTAFGRPTYGVSYNQAPTAEYDLIVQ